MHQLLPFLLFADGSTLIILLINTQANTFFIGRNATAGNSLTSKNIFIFFPRKNVCCRPRKDSEAYKYRTNEVMSYSAHCVYVKPVLRPFSVLVFISQLKALVTILNAGNEHCTYATTNLLRRFNIELNTKC